MAVEKNLITGSMTLLLLGLLSEKEMYGYEMIETLRERSNQVFELKAGTLYPLLHGMEEKGFLTSYEKEVGGKVRKYYAITGEGRKEFKKKQKAWEEYAGAVSHVIGGAVYGSI
ncbi:MAG: helix-turn-helix transcriptional regulator [Lachnospiraceae bacterium]|nr:helix-turn-helix transcriptional regulator [Lachnospiraceae bacterium]